MLETQKTENNLNIRILLLDMEVNIIEEKKNKLIFEVKGEGHTLANMISKELWNDSSVNAAGYAIDHPLVGIPQLVVETNSKKSAKKAVEDAVKRLKKQTKAFRTAFKKIK